MDLARVEELLREILEHIGAPYTSVSQEEIAGQAVLRINTDNGRDLIGPHGDAVHALDFLLKRIVEKRTPEGEKAPLFLVDVNDYRTRHIKDLQNRALVMAERARSFQYDVELNPMSAYERLIVHATLSGAPDIKTESHGEGRERRIVIRYVPQ